MPADPRLGIDVGGTNTDAVILDRDGNLAHRAKVPTTPDVQTGIARALAGVMVDGIEPERIGGAMLGTTQLTNAVLERRALGRVAVVRIGAPASLAIPPLRTWPADLRAAASAGETVVAGGNEIDGTAQAPLDADALTRFLAGAAGAADAVAITSIFSPVSAEQEHAAAAIARAELGDLPISLSHEIGSLGLLERENATVLNAALTDLAVDVARGFERALADHGIEAEAYFAQNDGTLMALEYALRFPVLTIGSGPANSMRGAAHLSGVGDGLVVDVGGTSTDIGVLANGFPRESSAPARIAGLQTNFRMPDLLSIALGGGSVLALDATPPQIGPASVGAELGRRALVFGGDVATLTDAAVAADRAGLGNLPKGWRGRLAPALAEADRRFRAAVERVRPGPEPVPAVLVGGGSIVAPDPLPGVADVHLPENFDVANAIGAAIAPIGGYADRVCPNRPDARQAARDAARELAVTRAVDAGAHPDTVEVVDVEEIPLSYLVDPAVRIRIRAVGRLL